MITVKPHPIWFLKPEQLILRITNIIGPTSIVKPYKDPRNQGKWTLNSAGWLLTILNDSVKLESPETFSPQQWTALQTVLEMFLT